MARHQDSAVLTLLRSARRHSVCMPIARSDPARTTSIFKRESVAAIIFHFHHGMWSSANAGSWSPRIYAAWSSGRRKGRPANMLVILCHRARRPGSLGSDVSNRSPVRCGG